MNEGGRWRVLVGKDAAWAWVAFALSLALTAFAWRLTVDQVRTATERRFEASRVELADSIRDRLRAYEQALRGGRGLFATFGAVTREEWRSWLASLRIEQNYPGVQGIGYAKWLQPGEHDAFVEQMRAQGHAEFAITPAGERPGYSSVIYLEPFDRRNRAAFGYDMWSEPVRRAAMDRARDSGRAVISGRVKLVQEVDWDVQPGFLMFLAHYAASETPPTPEERLEALEGFVYAPFRMRDFMNGLSPRGLHELRIELFDGPSATPAALLHDSNPHAPATAHTLTAPLEVHGRLWTMRATALPALVDEVEAGRTSAILAGGLLMSLLLFGVTLSSARTLRARAEAAEFGRMIEEAASEILVLDARTTRVLRANQGARDSLGYKLDELRGLRISKLERDTAPFFAALRRLGGASSVSYETRRRRKGGEVYDAEVTLHLGHIGGRAIVTSVGRDVSERKRAEAHQRMLMAELDHRVKNTLATAQSLAAHSASAASPADFVEAFSGRLAALARSHDLLTRSSWTGADLASLVEHHLRPYRALDGRNAAVEGPKVTLKPGAAMALGMALHELATNAAKHGALEAPEGRVEVSWRRLTADPQRPELELLWRERGGAPPAANAPRGFGRTLVERGLAYELDAEVRFVFAPEGLECVIRAPVEGVVESGPQRGLSPPLAP